MKTAKPHPRVISTHDAVSPSALVRVSSTLATTPAPKRISNPVPRNSDRMMLPALTRTPAVEVDPVLATCRPDHPGAPATGDASGAAHVVSIVVSDLGGRGGRRGAIGYQDGPRGCTACTVAGRGCRVSVESGSLVGGPLGDAEAAPGRPGLPATTDERGRRGCGTRRTG